MANKGTEAALADKARNLRYKRPMLSTLGFEAIQMELEEITTECDDVTYYFQQDGSMDGLINALAGEEDEAYEFQLAFAELSSKAQQLNDLVYDIYDRELFDDCTVAILGKRYEIIGFDSYQEDYFGLTSYEQELATTEAGTRLMRLTKKEMISTFGQTWGIVMGFVDLRERYWNLEAIMDIIRGENAEVLSQIKQIEKLYLEADKEGFLSWSPATKNLNALLQLLPDRMWLE